MLVPFVVSLVFVLLVVAFCFARPNAARFLLGLFFLLMAIGVNGAFTFANPLAYIAYAEGALTPGYRDLAVRIVTINPMLFGFALITFEVVMSLLILSKGVAVRIGLIGTMLFLIGIAPLSVLQFPWLGLIVGEGYLLTRDFDLSLLDKLQPKSRRNVTTGT